jgi:hypothetical protein
MFNLNLNEAVQTQTMIAYCKSYIDIALTEYDIKSGDC